MAATAAIEALVLDAEAFGPSMSNPLDAIIGGMVEQVTRKVDLPFSLPGAPTQQERTNTKAAQIIAEVEPRSVETVYGKRLEVIQHEALGMAPMMLSSSGDWKPARIIDRDGKALYEFVDTNAKPAESSE
jgi:hypothetical protein